MASPPEVVADPAIDSPASPASSTSSASSSTVESSSTPRLPSLRSSSDPLNPTMSSSSTHVSMVNQQRGKPSAAPAPPLVGGIRPGTLPQDMQAKMKAFHLSRQGTPGGAGRPQVSPTTSGLPPGGLAKGGLPSNLRLPPGMRPGPHGFASAPSVPTKGGKPSLSERRKMNLPGGLPTMSPTGSDQSVPQLSSSAPKNPAAGTNGSMFNKFSQYVDTKNGRLNFAGKAVIHGHGIDFSSGSNFSISLDEVDSLEELGKGNYGTVYKVRHARPRMRRPGMGLQVTRSTSSLSQTSEGDSQESSPTAAKPGTSGVIMAMKEIRLELDEAKFAAIIMELDILHRCVSPYIIDFYGAFFQEGAVYICIEFMDGGSIDKLYGDGIPENVLRKITYATTQGLRSLKDEHNIIHRDVKPTNILVNTRGQVKICDFGVSGNLVASIAKTNIGCQSYMAPERIAGGGVAQAGANPGGGTYSVQSDIWSLGLTIIECAMGQYPYPPETYDNIFSQLSAIVDGEPPDLPEEGYSDYARDFVKGCLNKIPKLRPTYSMLLQHPWLKPLCQPQTIDEASEEVEAAAEAAAASGGDVPASNGATSQTGVQPYDKEVSEWVLAALERKRTGGMAEKKKPALHAAPLDTVSPTASPLRDPIAASLNAN